MSIVLVSQMLVKSQLDTDTDDLVYKPGYDIRSHTQRIDKNGSKDPTLGVLVFYEHFYITSEFSKTT